MLFCSLVPHQIVQMFLYSKPKQLGFGFGPDSIIDVRYVKPVNSGGFFFFFWIPEAKMQP